MTASETGPPGMPEIEAHKLAEVRSRTSQFIAAEGSKPFGWGQMPFVEWATLETMLGALAIPYGARVLDVGCGPGWTSLFLAEAGYDVLGVDLVPANIELCRQRAHRWGSTARFEVADMEALPDGDPVDIALVFQALHHVTRQRIALDGIARRLRPGGWLLLSEPGWLHRLSPAARAVARDVGWMERGLSLRTLRRDLAATGFDEVRRWFQPTAPYEDRVRGFGWQLVRLVAANLWIAPQSHLWLAARRSSASR